MRIENTRYRLVALALAILLPACSLDIPLSPSLGVTSGQPKLDETVGVYMTPEFKGYVHRGSRYGDTWIYPLGQASSILLDQAFRQVFAVTVSVDSLSPGDAAPAAMAAIIEPRIEEFSFSLPFLKTGVYSANITYRFTMYRMDGAPFASWVVMGEGAKPGEFGFEFARWPGEAADLAMQDAAGKFVSGISMVPEVRRWLLSQKPQTTELPINPRHNLALR